MRERPRAANWLNDGVKGFVCERCCFWKAQPLFAREIFSSAKTLWHAHKGQRQQTGHRRDKEASRRRFQTPLAAAHQDGCKREGEAGKVVRLIKVNNANREVFLTAEWKHLAMLNYEIEPSVLAPFVPTGTELDSWNGKSFVSVVGFLFLRTRVFGMPIPFHRNFVEVNLRFYVRRKADDGWRRGVVFVKEIVPRVFIALVAQKFYDEPYIALPMAHRIDGADGSLKSAEYFWRFDGKQNALRLATTGEAQSLRDGSEAEFITEHFWGYNRQRDGSTLEYRVEHPRWRVYETTEAHLDCDVVGLYGTRFRDSLNCKPSSAFLADGSPVTVFKGQRLTR